MFIINVLIGLGASVFVGPASLAVRVCRGPFNLVVTISSWQDIVGHCFLLAHDLHELLCSVYKMVLLVPQVSAEFVSSAAQITVILIRY